MALRYAVDTNVLLRLSHEGHPQHGLITKAILELARQNVELCFVPQNLGEFWNVCTRPLDRNGLGLTINETRTRVQSIERNMTLLPENERVYHVWRRLLFEHNIRGVQVHDAHVAAVLEVHGVSHLITLNGTDFKRFSLLTVVHPDEVQPQM